MAKSNIDKLMELKQLYEQGILTKEEMEAEKQKILGQPHSDNTKSEAEKTVDNSASVKKQFNTRDNDVAKDNGKLADDSVITEIREEENSSFFQKHKIYIIIAAIIAVIYILLFSIKGNSEMPQAPLKETDSIEEILNQPKESMVYANNEEMIKRIDDYYNNQQKKGDISLEKFLRNDDIKNLILDKYNPSYYNAVMNLMKQNGYIGNVEVTSNGTYKGHANVSQRITGVDPYDDWAVDFSYNPNNNQLELKATVFDIPLKNDGSIDNEGIEKEIERLNAEAQKEKAEELNDLTSQAISIGTVIDAYNNNVGGRADNLYYKQEKLYKCRFKNIKESSGNYDYVLEGYVFGDKSNESGEIRLYTDQIELTNLNYPVTIVFRGSLVSINKAEYGHQLYYHFVCSEALAYLYN